MKFFLLEQAVFQRLRHVPDQGEIELRTIINRRTKRVKNTCPCIVPQRRLGIAKSKVIYFVLGVLLPCLTNKPSIQIGGIDRSRKAVAGCFGYSKGIRRVAELF